MRETLDWPYATRRDATRRDASLDAQRSYGPARMLSAAEQQRVSRGPSAYVVSRLCCEKEARSASPRLPCRLAVARASERSARADPKLQTTSGSNRKEQN